jgi:hypothetical protein
VKTISIYRVLGLNHAGSGNELMSPIFKSTVMKGGEFGKGKPPKLIESDYINIILRS